MTDTALAPKNNLLKTFLPLAATATVSATAGSEMGQDMAETLNWLISLSCSCAPPVFVLHLLQDICSPLCVVAALLVHYLILRLKAD